MLRKETDLSQKYRPQSVADCILPNRIRSVVDRFLVTGIENVILHGSYGIGKTSVAKALVNELECDDLWVNGSLDNSIKHLREHVAAFAHTASWGKGKKVVLIDEAERLSSGYQEALRGFMEAVSSNCAFVFTVNDITAISAAIQSRCIVLDCACSKEEERVLKTALVSRVEVILEAEHLQCDPVTLSDIISTTFPDIRKILKRVQFESTPM